MRKLLPAVFLIAIAPAISAQIAVIGLSQVTGRPLKATGVYTLEQTLNDGNRIHRSVAITQARDSQGRTYRKSGNLVREDGPVEFTVVDPVAGTSTSWKEGGDSAYVSHFTPHKLMAAPTEKPPSPMAPLVRPNTQTTTHVSSSGITTTTEQLGKKEILDLQATGIKTTDTIPAGAEGNSEPIVVTRERWTSRGLSMTLLSIDEDPRRGTTRTEITEVQQEEPDASLFQVPEGIKIVDKNPVASSPAQ